MTLRAHAAGAVSAVGIILGSTAAHAACAALTGPWALSAQVSNGTSFACLIQIAGNGNISDGVCQVFAKGKAPLTRRSPEI